MPLDTGAPFIVVQRLSPDSVIPGMMLETENEHLHLNPVQDHVQRYAPINQMLNSLASDKNIHSIAMILSGTGSEFSFTLTREILDEDKEKDTLPKSCSCYQGHRVMAAEDNLLNRETAETFLRSFGSNVDLVQNGQEAFKCRP